MNQESSKPLEAVEIPTSISICQSMMEAGESSSTGWYFSSLSSFAGFPHAPQPLYLFVTFANPPAPSSGVAAFLPNPAGVAFSSHGRYLDGFVEAHPNHLYPFHTETSFR